MILYIVIGTDLRLVGGPVIQLRSVRRTSPMLFGIEPLKTRLEEQTRNAPPADAEVWALSVQKCEFFHADVHAGNLLVLEVPVPKHLEFGYSG